MSELAPYAAREETSRGRVYRENDPEHRNQFQRDRDRVIHSSAFRRLEYKTQVFVNHEGDMFRTRLTHSIEVAQIGRTIARALRLNEDLTEAICLAHDLGHTPFGHAGQDQLNICMKDFGGFEHNLQSLRVVDVLEEKYPEFPGLNLMYETREGIIKHCSRNNAKKLGALGERFLKGLMPGLEAQVANKADEIAYNNHDTDDGLRSGLISVEQLKQCEIFHTHYQEVRKLWPSIQEKRMIHEIVRRMINQMVVDIIQFSQEKIAGKKPDNIEAIRNSDSSLIQQGESLLEQHMEIKQFLQKNLYRHHRVLEMTSQAKETVRQLFEAYMGDITWLPEAVQEKIKIRQDESDRARAIADYIAGMTDRFALAELKRLNCS